MGFSLSFLSTVLFEVKKLPETETLLDRKNSKLALPIIPRSSEFESFVIKGDAATEIDKSPFFC